MSTDEDTPVRQHMDDPDIKWRWQKPDYTSVNKEYLEGRTRKHPVDSTEKVVENLVKSWEMESTHKIDEKDWGTVDKANFYLSANGGWKATLLENIANGNYNILMKQAPMYSDEALTCQQSKDLFMTAFSHGFAWELLDLISGPPVVSFTWRHWARWTGKFFDIEPTGETLEMIGSCVVKVTEDLKIQSIDVYYDPNEMMAKMMGFKLSDWAGCPFGPAIKK